MEFVIVNVIFPILVGIVVDFIVKRINKDRLLPIIIGVLVALILFIGLLFIPPVRIAGVNWCSKQDGSTQISGRLTTSILGKSVAGEAVQIKVFEAGRSDPLGSETFTTTNAEGTFSVDIPQLSLSTSSSYLINVAYYYQRFILGERWLINDFAQGRPGTCP